MLLRADAHRSTCLPLENWEKLVRGCRACTARFTGYE